MNNAKISGRNPWRRTLFSCYCGYGVQAVINNLAPLLFVVFQDRFAVSLEEIGRMKYTPEDEWAGRCADILRHIGEEYRALIQAMTED